jgi:serine/threonine protein kinase
MNLLGKRLGRYELREQVGKGGMATVYKAWDTTLDRWVAVKVLHEHLAEETDFKARFEREAKLVASLSHPNIVQMYDYGTTEVDGLPVYFMVMQYIPGTSLKTMMETQARRGQPFSVADILRLLEGVCAALDFAHAQGMVHRDVTPGNILYAAPNRAVLADFGIARMVESSVRITQTGSTSGTPVYMSPELGLGNAGDQRSDIYSLGVILYELLTGRAPYDGDTPLAVLLKHVNEPIPLLSTPDPAVSARLGPVIETALAKGPDDRYQSAGDLLRAAQAAVSGLSDTLLLTATESPALPTRTRPAEAGRTLAIDMAKPTLRRSPSVPLWGVGLIALAVLIGVVLFQRGAGQNSAAVPTATLGVAQPVGTRSGSAPSMTSGPRAVNDTFDDPASVYWINDAQSASLATTDPNITRIIEDSHYRITHRLPATALSTIYGLRQHVEYSMGYTYEAQVTLCEYCPPETAAGIIFRYRNDDNYYVFAVNGAAQVSLWARTEGGWAELRKLDAEWTDAEGVNTQGRVNTLRIEDDAQILRAYVNGRKVIEVTSAPLITSGAAGIYLASSTVATTNPFAEVIIDNVVIVALPKQTSTPPQTS